MELANKLTGRSQQFTELYEHLAGRYSQLQIRYKTVTQEMIEYKAKANYWEAQFQRAKSREEELLVEVDELKAKLKKREQQLFGRSSEKNSKTTEKNVSVTLEKTTNKRGQQPGSQGHGRRDYSTLPMVEETIQLSEKQSHCPCCGLPYETLAADETSEILEIIDVQAYRRVIHRKRYKRCCRCKDNPDPQILLAPPAERLLPKGKIGITIWALLLINKYHYQQPLYRALEKLTQHGLSLSLGTITDGMHKLLPFFIPIYDAIVEHSIAAKHWHADETGWKVFEVKEGKANHRWFLWIFHNHETVVYKIMPSRSSQVLIDHFGQTHPGGILNVDRYKAYSVIAKSGLFLLAFCWVHVRRDFLDYAKVSVHQEEWALSWLEKISQLYHLNNQRILHQPKSTSFHQYDKNLREAIKQMKDELDKQLVDNTLLPSARKLLVSLNKHWSGLILFVDYPDIPMDNNRAERGLRPCVVGRKNYYGSGAIWSAQLAAAMFTLFETLTLWNINSHTWLLAYLQECVMYEGKPPDTIKKFLPWGMSPELRYLFAQPPKYENPLELSD